MVSRVILCRHEMSLFRLGGSPYSLDSVVHEHIESPLFVVNVAQDYFVVCEKADVIELNICLRKDELCYVHSQHCRT